MTRRRLQHDLTGMRFGMIVALEYVSDGMWRGRCNCGTEKVFGGANLRKGRTQSCGCNLGKAIAEKQTKPWSRHKSEVRAYKGMMRRCFNANHEDFQWYGARGITVCPRWLHGEGGMSGIECFLADMGPKPGKEYSLDRIDGTKGYEPGNCRWATPLTQSRNRAVVRRVDGKTFGELSEETGIPAQALRDRYRRGDRGEQLIRPPGSYVRERGGAKTRFQKGPLYRDAS